MLDWSSSLSMSSESSQGRRTGVGPRVATGHVSEIETHVECQVQAYPKMILKSVDQGHDVRQRQAINFQRVLWIVVRAQGTVRALCNGNGLRNREQKAAER